MKTFGPILLGFGLLTATTPHFFCPYLCVKANRTDAEEATCPHCAKHGSKPARAPIDGCDSPCCHGVDATLSSPATFTETGATSSNLSRPEAALEVHVTTAAVIHRSHSPPDWLWSSPHAGRRLPLALGHLLL